jgi:hypothetical protein
MKLLKISFLAGLIIASSLAFSQQKQTAFPKERQQKLQTKKDRSPLAYAKLKATQRKTQTNGSKFQKAVSQRLDSIVISEEEKMVFTYSNGECIKAEHLIWIEDIDTWIGYEVSIFVDGEEIETYWMDWYYGEIWGDRITYGQEDQMETETWFSWDLDMNKWEENEKYGYTYSNLGDTLEVRMKEWDYSSQAWVESGYSKILYDANDNEILYIAYDWNDNTSSWILDYKYEYFYDQHGNDTLHIRSVWENSQWNFESEYKSKYEYKYDANNNITEMINMYYDSDLDVWENDAKSEYEYNNNRLISEANSYWDTDEWIAEFKHEYTYNDNYSLNDLIIPDEYWYGYLSEYWYGGYQGMVTDYNYYYDYDSDNEEWEMEGTALFYYSQQSVSIINISQAEDLGIFPNPVKDVLNIQSSIQVEQISFYDLSGREIKTIYNPQSSISVNDLVNGMYIVKIKTESSESMHKIIKQ